MSVGNGQYIKFGNGVLMSWVYKTYSIQTGIKFGTYYYGIIPAWTFPYTYKVAPNMFVSIYGGASGLTIGARGNATTTNSGERTLISGMSSTQSISISWLAIGVWK
ncbi:hypothetical protein [uncultured Robinsoniella sp.]|uniref:hypothetical protein n=1 Tax=uncultured Robinsoniella sp. TaxID=904190 RepID=UPI00290F8157|nr:hypothetical protein [Clostridiales bacterium]